MHYNVIIIGAGPGGIFSAYEMIHRNNNIKMYMEFSVTKKRLISP